MSYELFDNKMTFLYDCYLSICVVGVFPDDGRALTGNWSLISKIRAGAIPYVDPGRGHVIKTKRVWTISYQHHITCGWCVWSGGGIKQGEKSRNICAYRLMSIIKMPSRRRRWRRLKEGPCWGVQDPSATKWYETKVWSIKNRKSNALTFSA